MSRKYRVLTQIPINLDIFDPKHPVGHVVRTNKGTYVIVETRKGTLELRPLTKNERSNDESCAYLVPVGWWYEGKNRKYAPLEHEDVKAVPYEENGEWKLRFLGGHTHTCFKGFIRSEEELKAFKDALFDGDATCFGLSLNENDRKECVFIEI